MGSDDLTNCDVVHCLAKSRDWESVGAKVKGEAPTTGVCISMED